MRLRQLTLPDAPSAQRLSEIAGWNQTEADWRDYLLLEPHGCFAAEVDGKLGGTGIALSYGRDLGWIGMVLVDPMHRRGGLGTALLRQTTAYLAGKGIECIKLDATPMGRKVYLPLGFLDDWEVNRFEGTTPAPSGAASDPRVGPLGPIPPPGLVAFDREAFGVGRPGVLSSLARRNPTLCLVFQDDSGIGGYLIAREGREAIQLGPWVARDPGIAGSLFQAFCRIAPLRKVFLDLPGPNQAGGILVRGHGFTVQRSFIRMVMGRTRLAERPERIYGTGGAEKG